MLQSYESNPTLHNMLKANPFLEGPLNPKYLRQ